MVSSTDAPISKAGQQWQQWQQWAEGETSQHF